MGPPLIMSLPIVFAAASVVVAILHQTRTMWRNRNHNGKPPIIPHFFPWFGSLFSIAMNPDRFFEDAGKAGSKGIFGATVGGNTRYYVTDAAVRRFI